MRIASQYLLATGKYRACIILLLIIVVDGGCSTEEAHEQV